MEWKFRSDQPIYSQLVEQIKLGIVSGNYQPGERLASVRDMAAEAGVNPNTMQRALQQLEREGLVFSQRSSGRFVTEDVSVIDRARSALAAEYVRRYRDSMASLGFSEDEMGALLHGSGEEEDNGVLS